MIAFIIFELLLCQCGISTQFLKICQDGWVILFKVYTYTMTLRSFFLRANEAENVLPPCSEGVIYLMNFQPHYVFVIVELSFMGTMIFRTELTLVKLSSSLFYSAILLNVLKPRCLFELSRKSDRNLKWNRL